MTPFQSILAAWLLVGAALVGLGVLVQRLWGARVADGDGWLRAFWVGFVAAIGVLQVWQIFAPVDDRVRLVVAGLGVVGLTVAGAPAWRCAARGIRRHALAVVVVAAGAVWLAQRCLAGAQNGDSGFYHIPTVHWLVSYPVVPGLANLFAALAYNQSYFLWVALLDAGRFAHRPHHLANGILVLVLVAQVVLALSRLVRVRTACRPRDLFHALLLPAAMVIVFDLNLTSPSPDVAVWTLWIVLSGTLLALLERGRGDELLALGFVAAGALAIKLSLAGLAAAIVPVGALAWLRRARPGAVPALGRLAALAVVMAAIVVPWMARGVFLSGYPLYPSTLGGFAVDWAAPRASVVAEADLIRYWNGVHDWWWAALRAPRWFAGWLVTLGWLQREPLLPLGVAVAAIPVAIARRRFGRASRTPALSAVILVPTLLALAFCFAAAPRARYGSAGFWVLAAQATLLAVGEGLLAPGRRLRLLPVAAAIAFAALPFCDGKPVWRGLTDFETSPGPDLHEQRLATGLVVHVPNATMCCWEGPFPCTPYPNEALRLRRDGDLAAGFAIDPAIAAQQAKQ